jgi:hypothetical protein
MSGGAFCYLPPQPKIRRDLPSSQGDGFLRGRNRLRLPVSARNSSPQVERVAALQQDFFPPSVARIVVMVDRKTNSPTDCFAGSFSDTSLCPLRLLYRQRESRILRKRTTRCVHAYSKSPRWSGHDIADLGTRCASSGRRIRHNHGEVTRVGQIDRGQGSCKLVGTHENSCLSHAIVSQCGSAHES